MKTMNFNILVIVVLYFISISDAFSQIKVTSDGKIGLKTANPNTNYDVHICGASILFDQSWPCFISDKSGKNGESCLHTGYDTYGQLGNDNSRFYLVAALNVHCLQTGFYSDAKMKKEIKPLESSLNKIKKLRGVRYDLKPEFLPYLKNTKVTNSDDGKNKIGFIAQEIKEVFPELVEYNKDADLYTVNYVSLIPVIVEALKAQDSLITLQSSQIKALQSIINSKNSSQLLESSTISTSKAFLEQNVPNPFSLSTKIGFYLPEEAQSASIFIYNMEGLQIKSYPIHTKGKDYIQINGSELKAGMYIYALLVDGKEVDTKRMILTE